jgi:hypothetical protein
MMMLMPLFVSVLLPAFSENCGDGITVERNVLNWFAYMYIRTHDLMYVSMSFPITFCSSPFLLFDDCNAYVVFVSVLLPAFSENCGDGITVERNVLNRVDVMITIFCDFRQFSA